MPGTAPRILVLKHGALGDAVLAVGALQAIRRHHAGAHLSLLTARPAGELLRATGLFDEIHLDPRARPWRMVANGAVLTMLRRGGFSIVYDLQGSARTSWYAWLACAGRAAPAWHRLPPGRAGEHAADRLARLLADARIPAARAGDFGFLRALPEPGWPEPPYVLVLPGSTARRTAKRWPVAMFAATCEALAQAGLTPVLIGTEADRAACEAILAAAPAAVSLCGRTSLAGLAELGRQAAGAIGNDTGPLHLLAQLGCPTLAIFGPEGDPARSAPRGARAAWIGAHGGWPAPRDVLARFAEVRRMA